MPVQSVHRVHYEVAQIVKQIAFVREIIARAAELLKLSPPDTFLGRKTYEPFPQEESQYGNPQS
ncbi:hypothetical protein [Bradyrhizobium elkanii]|uniref:hypothetical protein n=1 Tax=Bradyrhizobium elkanii TaxID=29448 RepID=UPI00209DE8A1|nr:hypothetical protein [Bradyrhizobium elkanii]MCP1969692.1 hypothetical protein [Bradyrhizobium elkanii]MCS4108800.1 hypothetical protein [Bradyrhizobium elkanii]